MKEIVVIQAVKYSKGSGVFRERLLDDEKAVTNKWGHCKNLWWFDSNEELTLENVVIKVEPDKYGVDGEMIADAIRFQFKPLLNIRATHWDQSVLHSQHDFDGKAVFEPFLPQLVAIVKQHLATEEFIYSFDACDFYGLFEVEEDEFRDSDGGLDMINVFVEFLGELDMDNLVVTPESKAQREASRNEEADYPYPYYSG